MQNQAVLTIPPEKTISKDIFRRGWLMLGLILTCFFLWNLNQGGNWEKTALGAVAILLGMVFSYSRFGFSYTWRSLVTHGDGKGIRAQMLWIILAAFPFALLTGTDDILSPVATANIRPLSIGIIVGAFLFGVGMQMGGACTSGSLFGVGQGGLLAIIGLIGFIIAAVYAASDILFWQNLPTLEPFSFYQEWGLAGVGAIIIPAILIALSTFLIRSPRISNQNNQPPLYRGAILLSILTVALLWLAHQPWGILFGFTFMGGQLLLKLDYGEVDFWDYWTLFPNGEDILLGGFLEPIQMVTSVGMILGVFLFATIQKTFFLQWQTLTPKRITFALAGGLLMGYGAQISFGCNIGSFISALSSGSAHGWLWFVCAFVGSTFGVQVRKWSQLP